MHDGLGDLVGDGFAHNVEVGGDEGADELGFHGFAVREGRFVGFAQVGGQAVAARRGVVVVHDVGGRWWRGWARGESLFATEAGGEVGLRGLADVAAAVGCGHGDVVCCDAFFAEKVVQEGVSSTAETLAVHGGRLGTAVDGGGEAAVAGLVDGG